jgi:hypothetical protein
MSVCVRAQQPLVHYTKTAFRNFHKAERKREMPISGPKRQELREIWVRNEKLHNL